MEQKEILKKLEEYKSLINDIKNKLDIDNKKNKISELEGISNDSSFWNDMENAKNVLSELKGLRDICKKYDTINESINDVNDIVNTGHLGCPDCYTKFEDRLIPSIEKIHGKTKHIGKNVTYTEAANQVESPSQISTVESLKNDLKQAVKEQRFEDAAQIRDKIKELENEQ